MQRAVLCLGNASVINVTVCPYTTVSHSYSTKLKTGQGRPSAQDQGNEAQVFSSLMGRFKWRVNLRTSWWTNKLHVLICSCKYFICSMQIFSNRKQQGYATVYWSFSFKKFWQYYHGILFLLLWIWLFSPLSLCFSAHLMQVFSSY